MHILKYLPILLVLTLYLTDAQAEQIPTTGQKNIHQIGQQGFCARLPKECMVSGKDAIEVELPVLRKVQKSVNDLVFQATDTSLHGTIEHWDFPKLISDSEGSYFAGDCEDIAILKRWELRELYGYAQSQLLLTTILIPMNEYQKPAQSAASESGEVNNLPEQYYTYKGIDYVGHITLIVRSPDTQDYLLDNLRDQIITWEQARDDYGYVFIFLENPTDPKASWRHGNRLKI